MNVGQFLGCLDEVDLSKGASMLLASAACSSILSARCDVRDLSAVTYDASCDCSFPSFPPFCSSTPSTTCFLSLLECIASLFFLFLPSRLLAPRFLVCVAIVPSSPALLSSSLIVSFLRPVFAFFLSLSAPLFHRLSVPASQPLLPHPDAALLCWTQ